MLTDCGRIQSLTSVKKVQVECRRQTVVLVNEAVGDGDFEKVCRHDNMFSPITAQVRALDADSLDGSRRQRGRVACLRLHQHGCSRGGVLLLDKRPFVCRCDLLRGVVTRSTTAPERLTSAFATAAIPPPTFASTSASAPAPTSASASASVSPTPAPTSASPIPVTTISASEIGPPVAWISLLVARVISRRHLKYLRDEDVVDPAVSALSSSI